jgi:hypothetical protein
VLTQVFQIASAPPGTQGANLDIAAAYRTLPILPDHRRYLCCQVKGGYYMDHNFPFGACSAHYCLGRLVDAIVDILHAVGISPVPKWADDLFPIRFPISSYATSDGSTSYRYAYDLDSFKKFLSPLSVPWHNTKWKDFSSKPVYLGLVWDFDKRTVALDEPKRVKYLTKVNDFLVHHLSSRVEKKLAMSLLGTLSHVTVVHQDGRSYLSTLSAFISTFTNEHKPRYPRTSVIKDLQWWSSKLSETGFAITPHRETQDLSIWVDASKSWGIGIVIGDEWDTWKWCTPWHTEGRNLGWAEAVAIELAAQILFERGMPNASVLIRGDNQGVIGSYGCGRGRNLHVNLAVRRTEIIGTSSNLLYVLEYTESKRNKADHISRGELGPLSKQISDYIQLPEELSPFLRHV